MTNPSRSYSKEEIKDKMTRQPVRPPIDSGEHEDSRYAHRRIHGKKDVEEKTCTLGGG